ncbi:hypothetical protein A5844_000622 [Enterococcus sp. 10A9_DIV0425]|uniref:Uncharacterized protein n=1 Tax=Candidatus Enterococcus wittei TaxID=1987383 RepID=A0A2C9XQF8_9ENTE|nr:hypothetical protein [Enterococcus sp. 10A9_DIV0425]OTP12389.1 hypothetical protein A5844_000622 [Enterococcus sp. 10A9_DIV0425]THE12285.1 hypothetical protein E1H99_07745 [Enterococcus hirae]
MELLKNKRVACFVVNFALANLLVILIGYLFSFPLAYAEETQVQQPIVQNEKIALSLERENDGNIMFRLEDKASEKFEFILQINDLSGKEIPLNIENRLLEENAIITEEQLIKLYFTNDSTEVKMAIKYKSSSEKDFKDLLAPTGESIQLPTLKEIAKESNSTQSTSTDPTLDSDFETRSSSTFEETTKTSTVEDEKSDSSETASSTETSTTSSSSSPSKTMRAAVAKATGTGSTYVPPGAITIGGAFAAPNGGAVVSTITNANDNAGRPFSQISLSGSNNWTSIWSNDAYKLDFTRSFSQRVYVNLGTQEADGVAFVMHNDSRKTTALTTSRMSGVDGQNLGVYGASGGYYDLLTPRTPESTAIQHSVAVEFDLFNNDGTYGASAKYDLQVGSQNTPHMAYTFPGNLNRTYQPVSILNNDLGINEWFTLGLANSARIRHNGLIPLNGAVSTNVRDGTWYEFDYSFDSTTRNFKYFFKNPVSGAKTAETTIPWADLNTELQLAANNNRAYWGFTAANGGFAGPVRFAFSQTPIPIGATLTNDILDANGISVAVPSTDTVKNKFIVAGQQARIKSSFKVNTGEAALNMTNWTTVLEASTINLATSAPLTPTLTKTTAAGVTTTISATNLSTTVTNNGTTGLINVVTTISNNALNLSPGDTATLNYAAPTKVINADSLTNYSSAVVANPVGTTPNPTNNVTYYGEKAYFWIRKVDQPTSLSWESVNTVTDFKQSLDISENKAPGYHRNFYWKDLDIGDTLSFKVKKGGTILPDVTIPNVTTTGSSSYVVNNQLIIPPKYFDYGENKFVIEVYSSGRLTNTDQPMATLNLNVVFTGELRLEQVPTNFSWTNRTVRQSKGTLTRDIGNKLNLRIWDSRDPRVTTQWSLGVSITTTANPPFSFVWKAGTTSTPQPLSGDTLKVYDSNMLPANGYEHTATLDENAGVLLESPNYLSVGEYSGRITVHWQLYDTAEIE